MREIIKNMGELKGIGQEPRVVRRVIFLNNGGKHELGQLLKSFLSVKVSLLLQEDQSVENTREVEMGAT